MKRTLGTLAVPLFLVAGCGDSSPPGTSPRPPASTSASPRTEASQLDRIVLVADVLDEPAQWEPVASIPFGESNRALSYEPSDESGPIQPRSFSVAPDGSFWILDPGKERVAHFSRSGTFLEAVRRLGPDLQDVVFLRDLMLILQSQDGRVAMIDRDGELAQAVVNDGEDPLQLRELFTSKERIFAQLGDPIEEAEGGGRGFAELDLPGSGLATPVPGLPVEREAWVLPFATGPQDLEIHSIAEESTGVQPVHIEIRRGEDLLDGLAGPSNFILVREDLAAYVSVSASEGEEEQLGGRWLLRIGESQLLWERLPDATIDDDQQVRHIAAGPDGSLYLLILTEEGVRILRRP